MKLFAIIFVVAVASCVQVHCNSARRSSNRGNDNDSSNESSEENSWKNNRDMQDIFAAFRNSNHGSNSESISWRMTETQFPEAIPFQVKITERLNGSGPLADKPEIKQSILRLANDKLDACKTPSGDKLDRACVGRHLGQMMQMIAAVENSSRHYPGQI
ncbi:uncharacterized protein LOC119681271 [Teleopsis dalmanni]|uniref:uncharacterized protein LOC119663225 n=1 Tax=Teleopsis dalmanni TaxID=139649 RepID=UPI000D32A46F|nr:uncharacterized protein LOC119663225 [Teleopsis dalmanni]XP_037929844.1 uncharacterized protein LOC119664430 [Teleopsis dalmanni]XP_037950345.1 uncharacterized protein LOC119681271 [Teleopsis dalmanni]